MIAEDLKKLRDLFTDRLDDSKCFTELDKDVIKAILQNSLSDFAMWKIDGLNKKAA